MNISFLTFESPNLTAQFWKDAVGRYEAKNPNVTVQILTAPSTDITGYALQLAGTGQLPDAITSVAPGKFVEAGLLEPYSEDQLKDFTDPMAGAIGGKQYQLPVATQVMYVYYNKALFQKAGITAPPTTFKEFLADCKMLQAASITPIQVAGSDVDALFATFQSAIINADVISKNPNWVSDANAGKVKFTDPDMVAALQKYADIVKDGYINADATGLTYAQGEQGFLDGKAAMWPMGNWFAAAGDKSADPENFGFFAMPTNSGPATVPAVTGGGIVISAASKHIKEAQEFAIAFNTDPDYLAAGAKTDGLYPAVVGFTPDPTLGKVFLAGFELSSKSTRAPWFGVQGGDFTVPADALTVINAQSKAIFTGQSTAE
ncbi:extracellular solute-binding protein, partial [Salinibacterium sp.]|uniref:ABC transporter substrate-binding protein n=1 Tax=Salinibacterium sp. TaxID=1915057 RepID=UPI00286BBC22